jgi:hypothetical protein
MIIYKDFLKILAENQQHLVNFYLPNNFKIPKEFHITDIGSVLRSFIDCGGVIRNESYLQIQLWVGKDSNHRIKAEIVEKIIKKAKPVLDKLPNLANSNIFIEYKDNIVSQYQIDSYKITDKSIDFYLKHIDTQCLAAIRYQNKSDKKCCVNESCC